MDFEFNKNYQPNEVEPRIYKMWEDSGAFKPKIDKAKKPFTITLPPPNITGDLHFGSVSFLGYADAYGRFWRMKGRPTLLLPGTDHSAISTQVLVEKLLAQEGIRRQDIGREKFLERVWEFVNTYRPRIQKQIRAIGVSADWSREKFTLDKTIEKAVKQFFSDLKRDGLLYKGDYTTTWCPKDQTVLSDLENIHKEEEGSLWSIRYPGKGNGIIVATTRPETMLGDTAVAVHPEDTRYKDLVGKTVTLPLMNREIPVIADESVDPKFGTGAVKVTPAHSEVDYEIGLRHKLEVISIIDKNATINENGGSYVGMKIAEARERIVGDLTNQGLIENTEKIVHSVGHCERCDAVTEQLITKQWFVKMRPLAETAIQAVKKGKVKVIPENQTKVLLSYLENMHDWTISRQLWWGYIIPEEGETDTLDTWFSSALWPFATLGWPEKTEDFEYFFPTSMMITAREIILFWISRMIMTSLYETKQAPFETVYLNPFVVDEKGQKMSKSKGNVLDALPLAEKYGMDAVRMSLFLQAPANSNIRVSEEKLKGMRNFANKIWNSARFVLSYDGEIVTNRNANDSEFMEKLTVLEQEMDELIKEFRPSEAAEKIYEFYWHEFCDRFIELTKQRRPEAQETLLEALKRQLILLHPFMPFVTEEIWGKVPGVEGNLITAKWPIGA
jgi:valyl-tRNA synthetase